MKIHRVRVVLQKVLLIVLAAMLLINLYIIIAQIVFKKDLPKFFGYAHIIVISGSMHPTLEVGDLLIIHEQRDYQEKDIVTYHWSRSLVTHRVIAINNDEVVTRGDYNNAADEPFSQSLIEGKVLFRIPKIGYFILFIKKPFGILLMVLLLIVLIKIPNIINRLKRCKRST